MLIGSFLQEEEVKQLHWWSCQEIRDELAIVETCSLSDWFSLIQSSKTENLMMQQEEEYRHNRQLQTASDDGWVDSMVEVARTCNKLFSKHSCNACNVYVKKQVEYETNQEQIRGNSRPQSPMARVWQKTGIEQSKLEVELYRQFLFDEESVVDGVSLRGEEEEETDRQSSHAQAHPSPKEVDEEQSVVTQRTQ